MAGGGGSDSFDAGEGTVPRRALCPHKETVGVLPGSALIVPVLPRRKQEVPHLLTARCSVPGFF